MLALSGTHYSGWPMAIVVGVIVALAFVRMTRERFLPMEANPVSRGIARVYTTTLRWVLDNKKTFLLAPAAIFFLGLTVWLGIGTTLKPVEWLVNLGAPADHPRVELDQLRWQTVRRADGSTHRRLFAHKQPADGDSVVRETRILPGIGREFMPSLDEGSFLYMPSLLPQAGLGAAIEVNAKQDMAIASVPEVESVVGKLGRAESALDPAPIGMMESIIILKPESAWRHLPVKRFFSGWPGWIKKPLAFFAPEHRQITKNEILTEL
jgi:Cu(I)/Ag(I) efflux system membrane protein CusA/SilA